MSRQQVLAVLLIGSALVFGGGGVMLPAREVAVELAALLIFWLWRVSREADERRPVPASVIWVMVLIFALPALQLIPLPPALWHALPGRETERAALALVGQQDHWRPWSVAPYRTVAVLVGLVPPMVAMAMISTLRTHEIKWAIGAAVLAAAGGLLLGAIQTRGGGVRFPLVFSGPALNLLGFQINKNLEADVLLIGMMGWSLVFREWLESRKRKMPRLYSIAIFTLGCIIFGIGVVLTGSRMGVLLIPVALLFSGLLAKPPRRSLKAVMVYGGLVVLAVGGLGVATMNNNVMINGLVHRFQLGEDDRTGIWRDSLYAINLYMPFGAGAGTFVPVFAAQERLEFVDPLYTNRAHNDYLELALEGGLFGCFLWLAAAAIVGWNAGKGLRKGSPAARRHGILGLGILAIISLHSVVDYPLRSISLASLAAVAVALLLRGDQLYSARRSGKGNR